MERYQILEPLTSEIGAGSYGIVLKAFDTLTQRDMAIKKIKLDVSQEGVPTTTLREISILRQLKHPNIVGLTDVFQAFAKIHLVFEFVEYDLAKYLTSTRGEVAEDVMQSIIYQIVVGVQYCHSHGVIHRDLKPQNILISNEGIVKIADFGLARPFIPPLRQYTMNVVTTPYRAPEILLGCKAYGLPVDLWSVGMVIAEIITKTPLFLGFTEIEQLFKIFRVLGTPNDDNWPGVSTFRYWSEDFPSWPPIYLPNILPPLCEELLDLLQNLICLDPRNRLTATECLKHPYFSLVF